MTRQILNRCMATVLCVVATTACDHSDVVAPTEDAEYIQGGFSAALSPDGEPSDYGDIVDAQTVAGRTKVSSFTVLGENDFSNYFKHTVTVDISVDTRIPSRTTQPLTYASWAKDGHISNLPIGIQCDKAEHTVNAETVHEAGFYYNTDKAFSVSPQYHCGPDGSSNSDGGWGEPGDGSCDTTSQYIEIDVWNTVEERWETIWGGYVDVCE